MRERIPLIAGNWKMHKTGAQAVEAVQQLKRQIAAAAHVEVMIAPPFTALFQVAHALKGGPMALGAQNLHWESQGAFTGEISAEMLVDAGCRYVIIGHSERRQYFGETDETVAKKVKAALAARLVPILCVGELEAERDAGKTFSVLDKQVRDGLNSAGFGESANAAQADLVIAYEPVWAIGTGKSATREQAQEAHAYIRKLLEKQFGQEFSNAVRILYGGSVNPGNVNALMEMPDVDGALVGGASLVPETFSKLVFFNS
ncbi:triose-phosphate isomerase [Desulfosarcina sp. OttesenSCG-928-G10]|nr:triose-phosphate isomerase [Desulfosarcina sp. OttesenSCG-928-G10]MDL2321089.1 triose-phosphate isomerase [Desulfosarcina sp. OttesenSCG-928-B08]